MEDNFKKILGMGVVAALWLGLAVAAWCCPTVEFSAAERRELAQFPEISGEKLLDGSFMTDFEDYTLDQFPLRGGFRGLKAGVQYYVLNQKDNNGIYLAQGQLASLEYPMNEASVDHALKVFGKIHERFLGGSRIYVTVVPDKSYYLAKEMDYPTMDYDALLQKVQRGMPYASYVNLTDILSAEDYYRTDTHWRQERLTNAANRLCDAMGTARPDGLQAVRRQQPFYGVYYGQAALPMKPDTLFTMESDWLRACKVLNYETGKYGTVYDETKLEGEDLYEVFLSGSVSLLQIQNPNATTDRELIVFRDSFGSSMVPLLARGYKTVTLVDIRYMSSAMLGRFIDFHGQDVLFLYSTLVLNNSSQLQ